MKKIIILGLLLIPSFSFAGNNVKLDIGEYSDIGGNNCTVNSDLSFDCSNTDNVIVGTDSGWLKRSSSYFWTNSGLAYYGYNNNDQSTSQGYISKFKYCGENGNPLSSCNSASNVSYDSFIEYYNSHDLTNWMWYSVQSSDGLGGVAFIFGNSYFVFAPQGGSNYVGVLSSYDFGLSGWGKDANYGTVGVIDTPFSNNKTPKPNTNEVCITVQELFDMKSNNYYTGLCYSTDKYLTQNGRVQITPKFITELYPTYTELRQDRNTRQNYCQPPATQQTCQTAFSGKEENRTILNKIPIGTDLTVLYDYCNIYQTRSGNMQKNFCDMTEEEKQNLRPSQMTTEGYAERIAKNPTTTTTPTTGTVYDGLTDGTNRDILEAIPRVYTKITGIFKLRTGKNGIIPYYITGILLIIVLFKLFKK